MSLTDAMDTNEKSRWFNPLVTRKALRVFEICDLDMYAGSLFHNAIDLTISVLSYLSLLSHANQTNSEHHPGLFHDANRF